MHVAGGSKGSSSNDTQGSKMGNVGAPWDVLLELGCGTEAVGAAVAPLLAARSLLTSARSTGAV